MHYGLGNRCLFSKRPLRGRFYFITALLYCYVMMSPYTVIAQDLPKVALTVPTIEEVKIEQIVLSVSKVEGLKRLEIFPSGFNPIKMIIVTLNCKVRNSRMEGH
jgi:hypothetical protein